MFLVSIDFPVGISFKWWVGGTHDGKGKAFTGIALDLSASKGLKAVWE